MSKYEWLERKARYAINSKSRNLVYEAYGMAKAFYMCDAISKTEFWSMNDLLVRDTMNNGKVWSTFK